MFRLKEIKGNISCISSTNKFFCFNTKQEELFLDEIKIDTITSVCGYFFSNNYFTYSNKVDYTNSIIDLKSKSTYSLGKVSLQFQKSNNKFIALEKVEEKRNLIIFDLLSNEKKLIQKNISFGIKLLSKNNLIINEGWTTLKSLSLLTGEYEWEVDLGGRKYNLAGDELEAKIRTIIDVIENSLFVWLDNKCLVEICIATGQIKSETFPLQELEEKGIITAVMLPQYHEPDQSIYFFYQDYLVQVHLPTQNTTLLWQDVNYNIGPFQISDNTIYFIGSYEKGAFFRNHIGVFDRKKNEVVWMQKVIELNKESYNNLKEIQASDTKIYVLDTEGTLYIFEKEETA
ncbi:MAG: hypothetical protein MUF45_17095 [Spirosomaceae bacterium]|jgi:hypothetical protein|nr:hypothetical protein [Spirosomataceae bacterium]